MARQVAVTRSFRVNPDTAKNYATKVCDFYDFCEDVLGTEPVFSRDNCAWFFEDYVSNGTGQKVRAHTAIYPTLSAWADFARDVGITEFPFPGTSLRAQLVRDIQGIENRYPHEPNRDTPITFDILERIAPLYGIGSAADLWSCRDPGALVRWARIVVAQGACMRACEHRHGCRVSDVEVHDGYVTILVGSRAEESKYARRPRHAILHEWCSHLSAAHVLRVLLARIHGVNGTTTGGDDRILFASGCNIASQHRSKPEPWSTKNGRHGALSRLRHACSLIGVDGHATLSGRCLRAGGATDLFAVNASVLFVKSQGGWKSDAYQIYNRPTAKQRAVLARVYASRRRLNYVFDRHDFFRGIP